MEPHSVFFKVNHLRLLHEKFVMRRQLESIEPTERKKIQVLLRQTFGECLGISKNKLFIFQCNNLKLHLIFCLIMFVSRLIFFSSTPYNNKG